MPQSANDQAATWKAFLSEQICHARHLQLRRSAFPQTCHLAFDRPVLTVLAVVHSRSRL
jgi:hypothetical protein